MSYWCCQYCHGTGRGWEEEGGCVCECVAVKLREAGGGRRDAAWSAVGWEVCGWRRFDKKVSRLLSVRKSVFYEELNEIVKRRCGRDNWRILISM